MVEVQGQQDYRYVAYEEEVTAKSIRYSAKMDVTAAPSVIRIQIQKNMLSSFRSIFASIDSGAFSFSRLHLKESIYACSLQRIFVGDGVSKDHISKTWEWREGRLLAYELLFQFLIKNHWLYTFGVSTRYHHSVEDHRR